MKRRVIWDGWQIQHMDEVVREVPARVRKQSRSVSLPNLTVALCKSLLPQLQQFERIQVTEGAEPDAIALLASLPKLKGIDLAAFRRSNTDPGRDRAIVQAVCALPHLTSLFATCLPGSMIPLLSAARGLRWLALWHPEQVATEHFAPLGDLPELEELQILGPGVRPDVPSPVIGAEAFQPLASRGSLRDIHILDLNLDQGAVQALLGAPGLEMATVYFPYGPDARLDVHVADHPSLSLLELTMPGRSGQFAHLPNLKDLVVYGFEDLILDDLPQLSSFEAYSVDALHLRALPSLRRVRIEIGPTALEVNDTAKVARMDLPNCQMDDAAKSALRAALPRSELVLERPTYKRRKRTAPKRSLGKNDWTHPQVGVDWMAYAVLVAGRSYEQDLTVSKGKELSVIAECWSQQLDEHVIAVMPFDLTRKSAVLSASDEVSPTVIGRVIGIVSADDGPSPPIDLVQVKRALATSLPKEFWAEMAGVIANDGVEQGRDGLYLVGAGPLAAALLAFGEVTRVDDGVPDGVALTYGQRFDQTPHELGVAGVLVESTEDCAPIELDELPTGEGKLHLICRYD